MPAEDLETLLAQAEGSAPLALAPAPVALAAPGASALPRLGSMDRIRVLLRAPTTDKTLRRFLAGAKVQQPVAERINRALMELGFGHLARLVRA